jgi:hypothetical protein
MDRIRRSFFWKGAENANGGHCLVRWTKVRKPKQLGGLEFWILNDSVERSGSDGFGSSGRSRIDHGLVWMYPVMKMTNSCSGPVLWSRLVTEGRRGSSSPLGLMAKHRVTLHHICSSWHGGKIIQLQKTFTIKTGRGAYGA